MTEPNSFSLMLRNLTDAYYHEAIGFEEYRAQRKIILDKIDEEFNGLQNTPLDAAGEEKQQRSSFLQTISFFRNNDSS